MRLASEILFVLRTGSKLAFLGYSSCSSKSPAHLSRPVGGFEKVQNAHLSRPVGFWPAAGRNFLVLMLQMYGFYVKICILRDVFCIAKLSENIQINPKMSASGEINFHRRRAFDRLKFSAIIAESFIIAKVGS